MTPSEPGSYRQALAFANAARQRAFARAAQVRFEVAVTRALTGQRPWYSRWYRPPRGREPFADAIDQGLRNDPAYAGAVDEMMRYLATAVRYARRRGHRGDHVLRWLLRQLVLLLRPLVGENAAVDRVAELVTGRRGP
ncbi:MAG: hypothetical protein V7603_4066 [Micromonosporaceae bacterium]